MTSVEREHNRIHRVSPTKYMYPLSCPECARATKRVHALQANVANAGVTHD